MGQALCRALGIQCSPNIKRFQHNGEYRQEIKKRCCDGAGMLQRQRGGPASPLCVPLCVVQGDDEGE